MRWTDEGAHLLVQACVAALIGELKMRDNPIPRRLTGIGMCDAQSKRAA